MKKTLILLFVATVGLFASCTKDKDSNKALALNTWHIDNVGIPNDDNFTLISSTLSTQGYQLFRAHGETNLGYRCTLELYFNTIGPPPTGDYAVVDAATGLSDTTKNSIFITVNYENYLRFWRADAGQTVHVIFANGTLEVEFNNLNIFDNTGGFGNSHTKLSVNLRK